MRMDVMRPPRTLTPTRSMLRATWPAIETASRVIVGGHRERTLVGADARGGGPTMAMPERNPVRTVLRLGRRLQRRWLPTRLDRILEIPGWTRATQLRYLMAHVRRLPDPSAIV